MPVSAQQGDTKPRLFPRLLVIISVLLLAAPTAHAEEESVQTATASLDDAWVAWDRPNVDFEGQVSGQRHFRSQYDFLDDSDAAVARAMIDGGETGSFEKFGLDLTMGEMAELERRMRVSNHLDDLEAAVTQSGLSEEDLEQGYTYADVWGPVLGGVWIDQFDGGTLKVAMTSGPGRSAAEGRVSRVVESLVSQQELSVTDVDIVDVSFSYAGLLDAQDEFIARVTSEELMTGNLSSGVDVTRNRLEIWPETEQQRVLANKFASGMPKGMVFVSDWAPPRRELSDPNGGHTNPHAGLEVTIYRFTPGAGGKTCTWGFTARTTSYVYMITAAHCSYYAPPDPPWPGWGTQNYSILSSSGHYHDWYQGSQKMGENSYSVGYNYNRGDIMRLEVNRGSPDHDDCYHSGSDCGTWILRRELTTESKTGETKCASVPNSNPSYSCAVLTHNDIQVGTKRWIRRTLHVLNPGDSGAGLKESTLATAILGVGGSQDSLWTHAYYVETKLGVTICGTSGVCN